MIALTGLGVIFLVQIIVNLYIYYAVKYLMELVGREKTSLIRKQFIRISDCCEKFAGYYGNVVSLQNDSIMLIHQTESGGIKQKREGFTCAGDSCICRILFFTVPM